MNKIQLRVLIIVNANSKKSIVKTYIMIFFILINFKTYIHDVNTITKSTKEWNSPNQTALY